MVKLDYICEKIRQWKVNRYRDYLEKQRRIEEDEMIEQDMYLTDLRENGL